MAVLQEIKVPLISVNDTSLTVVNILFAQADKVKQGDIVLVFETSKTTYDVVAEVDGFIAYQCVLDADYDVNEMVATIFSEKTEVPEKVVVPEKQPAAHFMEADNLVDAIGTWEGETLFSPAAIELMLSEGMSKTLFKGKDFVSKNDVLQKLGITTKVGLQKSEAIKLLPTDTEKVIVKKLSSNKKREIEYLSQVQSTGLTSTVNTVIETEGIFVHINQSLQILKDSLLPVIIYETARLLEKYKELNAYFTGNAIAYYKQVDIGFAIDIDKGLKVLRIPAAAIKSMNELEQDILTLSNKYLDDQLQIEDLTDISFTITDLSAEGVAFFKPLVNMMNSAILAVSAIDAKLNRCMLSVSFDHRVTEGKLVAQFLNELKHRLESYQSKYHQHPNQNISCFKCFKKLKDDLSDVGFSKCITPKGEEAFICQSCLKGF